MKSLDLYLASQSPRRAELLRQAGFQFEIIQCEVDETPFANEDPSDYVRRCAATKARAGQQLCPVNDVPVLSADTTVVIDNSIYAKPESVEDAKRMLLALSGREHTVLTALTLVAGAREVHALATSSVCFAELTPAQIEDYLDSGEWQGKAGGYAIQGRAARYIQRIEGSYTNIVGLPLYECAVALAALKSELKRDA